MMTKAAPITSLPVQEEMKTKAVPIISLPVQEEMTTKYSNLTLESHSISMTGKCIMFHVSNNIMPR